MADDTVKISANLPRQTLNVLKDLAARRGTTVTEALRRAIETDSFLTTAEEEGSKILIQGRDKDVTQIVRK
jgi:hypothetical protein